MHRQYRTLLVLAVTLAAFLLVIFFGPKPKSDIDRPISDEEIAQWAAQQDTGTAVEYVITSAYLIIPADDDPCGELLAIDLLSGEACSIPAETKANEIQFY